MTQKRKQPSAANKLVESLMDDLKDVGDSDPTAPVVQLDLEVDADSEKTSAVSSAQTSQSHSRPTSPPVRQPHHEAQPEPEAKVSFGVQRSSAVDNHLQRADNLSLAQGRILEIEQQLDLVRAENDQLSSSLEVARSRYEEATAKLNQLEKNRIEAKEQAAIDQAMYRENIQSRDYQVDRLKQKIQELEGRLQMDMKKIRVRERELENRLELSKAEKNALVRAKDETILSLKRKIEQLSSEFEGADAKCQDLVKKIEMNQEQFSRTVRALRLALTNLEAHDQTSSVNFSPLKKAD